ncbi:hypothetical protein QBC33DRAFT_514725 [Phialemonium atrogriseum]|uniref:Uncharacterized protein n=1 Tax=Phialemonium atrogriseum TaxID=1093897 RepID=A0AAJ0FP44_9PEZI|nr:uncharacterized protein QBC33DRAFT_514725 [Phialemonium atrogriseum]KAK1767805.1 hypothetical protein QBC33DRAFT_514725 [Phialemonium atrogriseum]
MSQVPPFKPPLGNNPTHFDAAMAWTQFLRAQTAVEQEGEIPLVQDFSKQRDRGYARGIRKETNLTAFLGRRGFVLIDHFDGEITSVTAQIHNPTGPEFNPKDPYGSLEYPVMVLAHCSMIHGAATAMGGLCHGNWWMQESNVPILTPVCNCQARQIGQDIHSMPLFSSIYDAIWQTYAAQDLMDDYWRLKTLEQQYGELFTRITSLALNDPGNHGLADLAWYQQLLAEIRQLLGISLPNQPSIQAPPNRPTIQVPPNQPSIQAPPNQPTVQAPPNQPTIQVPPNQPTIYVPPNHAGPSYSHAGLSYSQVVSGLNPAANAFTSRGPPGLSRPPGFSGPPRFSGQPEFSGPPRFGESAVHPDQADHPDSLGLRDPAPRDRGLPRGSWITVTREHPRALQEKMYLMGKRQTLQAEMQGRQGDTR